jgi:tetratricopeptide (TPR) repeat protein
VVLSNQGKPAEAAAAYRQALVLEPDFVEAYNNLGITLVKQRMLPEAIAAFKKAVEGRPRSHEFHLNLATALREQGSLPEAVVVLQKAIALEPGHAKDYCDLGVTLKELGKNTEATEALQKAIRLKPDYSEASYELGIILQNARDWDGALHAFRAALQVNPKEAKYQYGVGVSLYQKGDREGAIRAYQEAIRLAPKVTPWRSNLGVALLEKGFLKDALREFQTALEINPNDLAARQNLGSCLQEQARFADAVKAFQAMDALLSKSDSRKAQIAEFIRDIEALIELDARLPGILKGESPPASTEERVDLGWLCHLPGKRLYAAAARFRSEALAEDPKLAEERNGANRYDAARSAALAGCGQGEDAPSLDDTSRARLRRQALEWLQANLVAYRQLLKKEPQSAGPLVRGNLQLWQHHKDFAGVRDPEALAKMPERERQEWASFWKEVDALEKQAAD